LSPEQLGLLPLWYAVFLLAITCHEAAHAFAARRGGDPTAYHSGQVSLNPLPHIRREPFGTVLVPLASYYLAGWMMGWASAPYDPLWEQRHPRRAAWMAAAGPLANLALAAIAFAALKAGLAAGLWVGHPGEAIPFDRLVVPAQESPGAAEGLGRLLSIMLDLNLLLFVFNLIPVPPLDGASVLAGLFAPARRLRDDLLSSGLGGMIGILIAWVVIRRLWNPVLSLVLSWLY
jgi:Zn-dependent protease